MYATHQWITAGLVPSILFHVPKLQISRSLSSSSSSWMECQEGKVTTAGVWSVLIHVCYTWVYVRLCTRLLPFMFFPILAKEKRVVWTSKILFISGSKCGKRARYKNKASICLCGSCSPLRPAGAPSKGWEIRMYKISCLAVLRSTNIAPFMYCGPSSRQSGSQSGLSTTVVAIQGRERMREGRRQGAFRNRLWAVLRKLI